MVKRRQLLSAGGLAATSIIAGCTSSESETNGETSSESSGSAFDFEPRTEESRGIDCGGTEIGVLSLTDDDDGQPYMTAYGKVPVESGCWKPRVYDVEYDEDEDLAILTVTLEDAEDADPEDEERTCLTCTSGGAISYRIFVNIFDTIPRNIRLDSRSPSGEINTVDTYEVDDEEMEEYSGEVA